MALRTIRKEQDSALYKKCRQVDRFDDKLSELIDDMLETMYNAEGVGLAAPQVGILRRVVVIDTGEGPIELINPEIIESDGCYGAYEGCLSFPGKSGYVERAEHVTVCAADRFGKVRNIHGDQLLARAIQHELDHLDGLVYLRLVTDPPEGFEQEDEDDA